MTGNLVRTVRRRLTRGSGSVKEITPSAPGSDEAELLRFTERVGAELGGAGPLQALLDDPQVTDVLVNGADSVWIDRGAGLVRATPVFEAVTEVRALATRLANACGRRLDDANPCVDARLPDGTRVHAILPPAAVDGPHLSLRTHRAQVLDLDALHTAGSLPGNSHALLSAIVAARAAFLVTGGTGSGKTTVLSALLTAVPAAERILIVEEATELAPRHPHVISLQTRKANVEGAGEIGLRQLVRESLRMRPDRIVIGECRGPEIVELLTALNTGHDGGAGTLHANTAEDVPARLAALALPYGLSREGLRALIASALRIVIHMRRSGLRRYVSEIALLDPGTERSGMTVIPAWRHHNGAGPGFSALRRLLNDRIKPEVTG